MNKIYNFILLRYVYISSFILLVNSCTNISNSNNTSLHNSDKQMYKFKFEIESIDNKIMLPKKLNEISGLSHYKGNKLLCIEDEHSDIYTIDYITEEVERIYKSGEKGDFEGIEYFNNNIYILKSNGEIISFRNFDSHNIEIKQFKTGLSSKNDTEGLTVDHTKTKLLIACKESPDLKKSATKYQSTKAVYSFDLIKEQLNKKPEFMLSISEIKELTGFKKIKPSGIALHPTEKNYYIISSVGKLIIVINLNGQIIHTEKLPSEIFEQPEGICFNNDGTIMFISNEGKKDAGNVLMFNTKN